MNTPTIPNAEAAHLQRRCQRGALLSGLDRVVQRQRAAELRQSSAERFNAFQLGDFGIAIRDVGHGGYNLR
jgi:hypothetical protein